MSDETDRKIERLRSERNRARKALAEEREMRDRERSRTEASLAREVCRLEEALWACNLAARGATPKDEPHYGDTFRTVLRLRARADQKPDPWPAVETALAQAAGARLQPLLEGEEADCYVFADGEGLWFTTFGGPTPGRQPLLTGGAMLREGMPTRVLSRLLSMVRSGGEDYGLTLEDPAVVCEACGAFGWGDPCESLDWQRAGTLEDGTLHFCPRCRYEDPAAAYHAAHPDEPTDPEPADFAADLPDAVVRALRDSVLPAGGQAITWLNVGGDRWCILRTGSGDGNRVTVDVLRVERAYDLQTLGTEPEPVLTPYYQRKSEEADLRVEVARLTKETGRLESALNAIGDAVSDPIPETVALLDSPSEDELAVLRLRVRYEALKQDRRKSGLFSDEIVDRIEAEALRARGMEP